ncbi:MAG TPA: hypothetical protein DCZ72_00960, partial [Armatimonadetes bacterium]|nr:hypothetical protein [Armatimonadota bacterium]
VAGQSVERWLLAERPTDHALGLGAALLRALHGWHEAGYVHGRLHPGNVIIDPSGLWLTDWDQAEALEQSFGLRYRRPEHQAFLAPEVRAGGEKRPESDVYSVGVLLYETLTGQRLPADGTLPGLAGRTDLPAGLRVVLEAMLTNEPDGRYPASQAAEALERLRAYSAARQAPVEAPRPAVRPPVRPERLPLWVRLTLTGYRLLFVLIFSLVLSLATVAAAGWGVFRWLDRARPTEVIVPDVITWAPDNAEQLLRGQLGLNPQIAATKRPSVSVDEGKIVALQPPAGRTVRAGRKVVIYLSSGPEQKVVPNLTRFTLRDAEARLANVGLKIGNKTKERNPDLTAGYIIRQDPPAGQAAKAGSPVHVWYSGGRDGADPPAEKEAEAEDAAESAEPAAEAPVDEPPATDSGPRKQTIEYTVPTDRASCMVKIVVRDDNGEQIIYNRLHQGGDTIRRDVEGQGRARIEIYLDDLLEQQEDL